MNEDEARRRVAAARVGRLATVQPQGLPHLVPVVFALVDDVLFTAVDDKPKTTRALKRLSNIDATGWASLLVDEYCDDWSTLWWVRVDGTARVLSIDGSEPSHNGHEGDPEQRPAPREQILLGLDALTRKYPQYASQPPPGPVIAVRLTRWRWWEATRTS